MMPEGEFPLLIKVLDTGSGGSNIKTVKKPGRQHIFQRNHQVPILTLKRPATGISISYTSMITTDTYIHLIGNC